MAKKVVAKLKTAGKSLVKVIRSVRSAKTGAYTFKEEIVLPEEVQKVLARKDD